MATPRRLRVPSPSPVLLNHDALITVASAPEYLGEDRMAYALLPEIGWRELQTQFL